MKTLDEQETQKLNRIMGYYEDPFASLDQQSLIACLKEIQSVFGFVPRSVHPQLIKLFNSSEAILKSLIHRIPGLKDEDGPRTILICNGPRCQEKDASGFLKQVQDVLGCKVNQISKDGRFELRTQACLRRCALGKNMNIDTDIYTEMTTEKFKDIIEKIKKG